MQTPRVAIVGAGSFGRSHIRVLRELPGAEMAGVLDTDPSKLKDLDCPVFADLAELAKSADAAVVAVPTSQHAEVGCALLEYGLDVLVEKPIAPTLREAERLIEAADRNGCILQVGHLERFNPAVEALKKAVTVPLFFEIHRMSVFTPRSLDVDVVLDLMIHDIDILLSLTHDLPEEIRAAGIRILSEKVDIANVRLAFANGCVANLTASRVSTEKIRKLRLFQPEEYISLDYARQDASRVFVKDGHVGFDALSIEKQEPLRLELESFVECVRTRKRPRVTGSDASRALEVSLGILDKIKEHGAVVQRTVLSHQATANPSASS
jgi:predicted dehydrogenase